MTFPAVFKGEVCDLGKLLHVNHNQYTQQRFRIHGVFEASGPTFYEEQSYLEHTYLEIFILYMFYARSNRKHVKPEAFASYAVSTYT